MELIKGRKSGRTERPTEEMYRVPASEDQWEVACCEEPEMEEREVPTDRKRRDLPLAS